MRLRLYHLDFPRQDLKGMAAGTATPSIPPLLEKAGPTIESLRKRIALNAPAFPESKFTMKSIRLHQLGRMLAGALLAVAAAPCFSARCHRANRFHQCRAQALPRRPSIILIVADGLGYGDLSCYGQTKFQTPNLDRLAAEGVRFTGYYAGDAESSPSRAALMLGRDSGHLEQRADVDVPLAADDITSRNSSSNPAYHTGLIGEWDLGGDGASGAPWNKGFDEFAGYFDPGDAENYYADFIWRQPMYPKTEDFIGGNRLSPIPAANKGEYIPDLLTEAALNFVKNNRPERFNHYRSFFLLLDYTTLRPKRPARMECKCRPTRRSPKNRGRSRKKTRPPCWRVWTPASAN